MMRAIIRSVPKCTDRLSDGTVTVLLAALLAGPITDARAQWPQWGGPNRNFTVETKGLAKSWPEDGPRRIWHRELGDGYSAIVVDDGMLYTMYRKKYTDEEEFTVALDAKTGKTVWQHKIPAPLPEHVEDYGYGPYSTPLMVGDCLWTISTKAVVRCYDKKSGEVLWRNDLVSEFGAAPLRGPGYASSPLAYKDTIILLGWRKPGRDYIGITDADLQLPAPPTIAALDQRTGRVSWKNLDFDPGPASPVLINFAGKDQLVVCVEQGFIGVDPENGELLWHHKVEQDSVNVTPIFNGKDLIFWSNGGQRATGGRALRLFEKNGKTAVEEVWSSPKIRFAMPTPVLVGDYVYGSSARILMGVNIKTGKRTWAKRGFDDVACVYADGKFIFLDENGHLGLATVTPEELTVHSTHKVTERYSFTVPTLVDTTLYVRDRRHIMALDLGRSQ
ncbi:MAG: PQQ-binding-like beta-propeller repeat protein [Phycisphaerales bacterium]|nr:MAG: PQQ-binding-like beta-propeller repeat protein [Phycisphaerales bacterium]